MKDQKKRLSNWLVRGLILVYSSVFCIGQAHKGSVYVEITDVDGEPLPGVVIFLESGTVERSLVTDAEGKGRFVGLIPDVYALKAVMTGFNTVIRPNISVNADASLTLLAVLAKAENTELIPYCSPPTFYAEKQGSTVVTEDEFETIPHGRDPWAILGTISGLQTDRFNMGGNESGQQALWAGNGNNGTNNTWMIDGVDFTDFAEEGASQSYLDMGSFSHIRFKTAAAGVEVGPSGTVLNFVTKQSTNIHKGSMRLLWADEDFVSTNVDRNDPANINPDGSLKQNTVFETFEKGFEIGGPIIKDRLWYWGAFHQNTVKNITRSGQRDDSDLENISLKISGNLGPTTSVVAFYTEGDKLKFGLGSGPTRAPETTWSQDGPTPIYKFELSQLIGQHTELRLILGRVDGGFNLTPVGDNNRVQAVYNNLRGRWENTLRTDTRHRPQRSYKLKGQTFLNHGDSYHEMDYGFEYKRATANFRGSWGEGSGNVWLDDYHGFPGVPSFFRAYRDAASATALETYTFYVQDTITFGDWTINGGARYNHSEGNNQPIEINPNPFYPELVPAFDYAGEAPQFTWESVAPLIGATYTFGGNDQYLMRANYRVYYDDIAASDVNFINPIGTTRIIGYWTDHNGDRQFTPDEGSFSPEPYCDPVPCTRPPSDTIDPNLDPPRTNEFTLSGEWRIPSGLTLGAAFVYRVRDDVLWEPLKDISSSDYEIIGYAEGTNPVNGEAYRVPQYALSEAGRRRNPWLTQTLTNRPDYEEIFHGLQLTATKHLTNRWMMRGHISWQDWTHDVGPNGFQDPSVTTNRGNVDGGAVLLASGGSGKGDVYIGSATYSAHLSGAYQLPWGFNIAASLTTREGYSAPLFHTARNRDYRGVTTSTALSIGEPDTLRMDDILFANLKLTNTFSLGENKIDLGIEVFNLFNDNATLQVQRGVATGTTPLPNFGRINESLAPRLLRFSATVSF